MIDWHGENVGSLAKKAESEGKIGTWDYALPLAWYEDVHKKLGIWPQEYGFVWNYPPKSAWGEPYPLTDTAKLILGIYEHVCQKEG